MTTSLRNWQAVQDEVRRRIHARDWPPGSQIPNEADLAAEFGCARATVNRALRSLADAGLLDRRRKAGTRVALQPVAKATLEIPVLRLEIEALGRHYGYRLLMRQTDMPPDAIKAAMRTQTTLLHLQALHLANGLPYAFEDRWIDTTVVPAAQTETFTAISGNEWLLRHAPYTHGQIGFSAIAATPAEADILGCAPGSALFQIDRLTWDHARAITQVRLAYAPGHRMQTAL